MAAGLGTTTDVPPKGRACFAHVHTVHGGCINANLLFSIIIKKKMKSKGNVEELIE